jgi:serine/threonine protein kinase
MHEENRRVLSLFAELLEAGTPEEQAAYLDRVCSSAPELRARLEALLRAHHDAGGFLGGDVPPPDTAASHDHPTASHDNPAVTRDYPALAHDRATSEEHLETTIGPYKLLEQIGEGGMGTVYMAQQTEPMKRVVAVKVIKAGMDSKAVLARFEAERQALAMMDHPNIARVLDAGTTKGGRPYFVMELVKGIPITEYCDERKFTPRQRLELFLPVCQAIQHAHQKGIIHRDIKPSNVLVAMYDERPVPKVIDFGVAKATGQTLTDKTLVTGFGAVVGTPEYMSPEQANLNNLDIDTRSDVYSLGVLLYELLTGTTPVDRKSLGKAAPLEILRIVREVEAPRPSAKLSTNDALPSVAANRSIEPAKLTKLMRGELDWVVMKALEKDRTRRYDTVNALALEIQRYLADEVVEARPPSSAYRLRKFASRHKGQVIAASLVFFALLTGITGTTWGLIEAKHQEKIAREETLEKEKALQSEAVRAESERLAKVDAQEQKVNAESARDNEAKERGYAEAIAKFVMYDFLAMTSVEGQDRFDGGELTRNATLRELLDRAADKLRDRKGLAPRTEAELCLIIGVSYRGVGEPARAIPFLERCVKLHRQASGPLEQATLNAQNSLAAAYEAAGDYNRAATIHEETLKLMKATLGPDHLDTLRAMNNLALDYVSASRLNLALPLLEEVFRRMKARFGPDHRNTLKIMGNLADGYREAGQLDRALPLFEEVLKLKVDKLGPDHPNTLDTMAGLAQGYLQAGQLNRALPLYEETIKLMKVKLGPDQPKTLSTMAGLAVLYWSLRQLDKSIPMFEDILKQQEAKLGRSHPYTQATIANLGVNYRDAGLLDKAIPLLEEVHRTSSQDPILSVFGQELLDTYIRAGRSTEAAKLVQELLDRDRKKWPKNSPGLANSLAISSQVLLQIKAFAAAEPILRECLAIRENIQAEVWSTFNTRSMLGGALLGQKKYSEAEPLLLAGYEGMKQRENTIPPQGKVRLPQAVERLIDLYTSTNKPDEVKRWRAELAKYPVVAPMPRVKK